MSTNQIVFDESGVWITNTGAFPCIDWFNGCRFNPGVPTKAPETAFVKGRSDTLKVEKPVEPVAVRTTVKK